MKLNHSAAAAIAVLALVALAASPSQAAPDAAPKVAPVPLEMAANPEWGASENSYGPPGVPDGVVAPLTHRGKLAPNVPAPPLRIASLAASRRHRDDPFGSLKGLDLASTALLYRGVPYRWAGMSSRGMDCSGLITRVMQSHGIRAPHQSSQLFKLGRPVGLGSLQAGDLLFFRGRRQGIGHVGMYIGNGKFIHASSGAGRVVISPVSDKYYLSRYVGSRRLH